MNKEQYTPDQNTEHARNQEQSRATKVRQMWLTKSAAEIPENEPKAPNQAAEKSEKSAQSREKILDNALIPC